MKTAIIDAVRKVAGNTKLKLKQNSPTLLIVGGIISAGACVVTACVATTKISPIVEETKNNLNAIRKTREEKPDEYCEKTMKKDLAVTYGKAALGMVKLYSVPIATFALSVTGILAGSHILKARNAALAAAYLTVDKSFKGYRKRVADRFGEEAEKEIRSDMQDLPSDDTTTLKDGVTTIKGYCGPNGFSDYARVFDESSCFWEKDAEINLWFLKGKQQYWNDKLVKDGHVFLNDIYKDLDLQTSKAGKEVGWIYDPENPNGDNYIDFGIYDVWRPKVADFVNGTERSIILDFNVDGPILSQTRFVKDK